eukprot:m.171079 g.171079  ORF g.171079 m.171079 type:complete len:691 (+) comp10383_c0_seq9:145-2217(+)
MPMTARVARAAGICRVNPAPTAPAAVLAPLWSPPKMANLPLSPLCAAARVAPIGRPQSLTPETRSRPPGNRPSQTKHELVACLHGSVSASKSFSSSSRQSERTCGISSSSKIFFAVRWLMQKSSLNAKSRGSFQILTRSLGLMASCWSSSRCAARTALWTKLETYLCPWFVQELTMWSSLSFFWPLDLTVPEQLRRERFNPYFEFCGNQNPASELYFQLKVDNPLFAEVIATSESNLLETRGFDLPAFLLKGMQRLLKYQPLLQQVLKYTKESETKQVADLNEALMLVQKHAAVVNEVVRARENARRLPVLQSLLVHESSLGWIGRRELDLDLTADPARLLLLEGPTKLLKHQAVAVAAERKAVDYYLILLSDQLLLTIPRDQRYVIREARELQPVIPLHTISDIRSEITLPGNRRTTLVLELGAKGRYASAVVSRARDAPRAVVKTPTKKILRFELPSQNALRTWLATLLKAHQDHLARLEALRVNPPDEQVNGLDEFAVSMLVTSRVPAESCTDDDDFSGTSARSNGASGALRVPDWELSFEVQHNDVAFVETTRHVRVVRGENGIGMTLIGRNPVTVQEIEPDGPAFLAGIRAGDEIRAVSERECTNCSHEEVVDLIKEALSVPQPRRWAPMHAALEPINEIDTTSLDSRISFDARGPHRTRKRLFLERPSDSKGLSSSSAALDSLR